MIQTHLLSERRACCLVGLSRDSFRHPPKRDALTQTVSERIVDIAHVRRRFGYRRIHDLLRPEFSGVNHKRVYRFYKDANLAVRRCKKAKPHRVSGYPCNWRKTSTMFGAWILSRTACPMAGASSA